MPRAIYSVWYEVQSDEQEWKRWMTQVHIPDVVKAGNFRSATLFKVRDQEKSYVTLYEADDMQTIENYLKKDGPRMREEYQKNYGTKSSIRRLILEEVMTFSS